MNIKNIKISIPILKINDTGVYVCGIKVKDLKKNKKADQNK
jgi:hypothetical protein